MELVGQESPLPNNIDCEHFVNGHNFRWRKIKEYEIEDNGKRFYIIIFGILDHMLTYSPLDKTISINGSQLYCKNTAHAEEYVVNFMKGNKLQPNDIHKDIVIESINDLM